jgi:hypothetical protein
LWREGHYAHQCPTLAIDLSSSRPRKRRKCIQKIEDGHDPDLDGYYMEECFPRIDVVIESLRKYFRFI